MSTQQLSAARTIWRARRAQMNGGKADVLYISILVSTIAIVPAIRTLWIVTSSVNGVELLTSANAPVVVSLLAAALWAGGLLLGRKRGPALLPPFPLHVLLGSRIRRSTILRKPVLQSGAIIVAACVAGAVLVGMGLFDHAQAPLWGVIAFAAAAIATGIVATLMWLVGQVFRRAAFPLALTLLAAAGLSLSTPQLLDFTPWGWVGATYPLSGSGTLPVATMTVLAAAFIVITPGLLDRLTGMQLASQAAQWERATAFSFSFDFRAATSVYETAPRLGRSLRVIRPSRHRWVTFLIRDVTGQLRTPGRSLAAVFATALAGILMTLSFLPGTPSGLLAGAAGAVVYGASGPLTKGLQHAAHVATDYPLYGIGGRHLVLLHTIFPLASLLAALSIAATVTAFASGAPLGVAFTGACAIGALALTLRIGSALKGSLPPILLTPMSTPSGDLSIVVQVGWAFGEPLLAILGSLTIPALPITPIPLVLLMIWAGVLIAVRWRKLR